MGALSFQTVRDIGLKLPNVVEGTSYGSPALKLDKKLLACVPTNKSAEAESIVVYIDVAHRAQLLDHQSDIYYITDHYKNYPFVLVRLAKIKRAELANLLRDAHAFLLSPPSKKATAKKQATKPVRKAVSTKTVRKR